MAKSVGNIVDEMNAGMTRREASRMAQNERRKAQRRLARILSEETGQKVTWKDAMSTFESLSVQSSQAKSLARTIQNLQAKTKKGTKQKVGYSVDIKREAESIAAYTQIRYGSETLAKKGNVSLARRNKMFERQLNQSTTKNGLSALEKHDTKAFYAATMDLWKGLSNVDNRNASIMMKFGMSDLSQVHSLLIDKKLSFSKYGFTGSGYKDSEGNKISYEEYKQLRDTSDFEEYSEEFDALIEELDDRVQLSKRREIVQQELDSIRGSQKTGGTTEDSQYNGKEEKTAETSPEYLNRIISRIAMALNNG